MCVFDDSVTRVDSLPEDLVPLRLFPYFDWLCFLRLAIYIFRTDKHRHICVCVCVYVANWPRQCFTAGHPMRARHPRRLVTRNDNEIGKKCEMRLG